MIRFLFSVVLPLLLPTLVYFGWIILMRRAAAGGSPPWQDVPWTWLALAGVAFAAGVLALVASYMGSAGNGHYVPPRVVDGQVVPGHIEPAPPAPH